MERLSPTARWSWDLGDKRWPFWPILFDTHAEFTARPKAQYKNVFDGLLKIVHTEGFLETFSRTERDGTWCRTAHAMYFSSYEKMKRTLSDAIGQGGNSHLANGIAGGTATLIHDAVMTPAEAVKQRMQMFNSPYKGVLHCIRVVYKTEGIRAFYWSYTTQLTMNVPFQAIHFMTYEFMQEQLNPCRHFNPLSHMLSGALAGATAAAATTPLDVCKTLLNTQENLKLGMLKTKGRHLSGMLNACRMVYKLGGLPAYFKGVQARVIYQMPSTAICWSVYEFFKYFITQRQSQDLPASS